MEDDKLKKIAIIANNALCYNDNSDFETALWEILNLVYPNLQDYEDLTLMEDEI
jgi:hypothetical protein